MGGNRNRHSVFRCAGVGWVEPVYAVRRLVRWRLPEAGFKDGQLVTLMKEVNVIKELSDEELRAMRDLVYPATSPASVQTDASWQHVKHNWRNDAAWLATECAKLRSMCWNPLKKPNA